MSHKPWQHWVLVTCILPHWALNSKINWSCVNYVFLFLCVANQSDNNGTTVVCMLKVVQPLACIWKVVCGGKKKVTKPTFF